ncbi:MAG: response regulator transcription factor [Bacteroidia bacterium]|nr:response regulator transcription factor [Bacteroidia bacterium]
MPKLSGIDFIRSLKEPPLFVLVTAYPEYALKGFEVDAVDYLVKPVSFERFRIAVNRAQERFSGKIQKSALTEHIMVRADKKNYRIHFDEIFFLEAQGDYVKFVTSGKSLMVHGTLKDFDAQLPSSGFAQIHKSYIISLSKVDYIEGNLLKIGDYKLPVSITYREQLMQKLN